MRRGLTIKIVLGQTRAAWLLGWLGLASLGLLAGCGEPAPNVGATADATLVPPHGGAFVKLADAAYGEVVVEVDPKANKDAPTQIVVYFFEKDGKSPLAAAVSDVKVELVDPVSGEKQMFDLDAKAKDKEGTRAPRYASKPLKNTFDDQISGSLIVNVGGASFSEVFVKRQ